MHKQAQTIAASADTAKVLNDPTILKPHLDDHTKKIQSMIEILASNTYNRAFDACFNTRL